MFRNRLILLWAVLNLPNTILATSLKECFSLREHFQTEISGLESKIASFEQRFKDNPDDYLAKLASSILIVAKVSQLKAVSVETTSLAVKYCEYVISKDPLNPLALTFCGLAYSLIARDSRNMITQWISMKKCLFLMDKGVKMGSGSEMEWYVRFLRANCYSNLPKSFNKWDDAESDYIYIFAHFLSQQEIEPYLIAASYYRANLMYAQRKTVDAFKYWQNAVTINKKLHLNVWEASKAIDLLKYHKQQPEDL